MRSYNQKKKNNIIIGSLLGVMLLMTVGYAAFNSVLKIKGTSGISSNWDVRITNVVSKNIVGGATNAKEPTWEALTASMEVNLEEPKDSIEYDITVTNNGTINAKLDKINLTDSNNPAIKFTTSGLTEGTKLKVGESAVLTIKVEYLDGVSVDPNNMSSTLTVTLEYSQANINNDTGLAYKLAAEQLTENIVTSGDGLYEDTTEAGRYVYKGANPNNYITFNDESWRIISVESDGTLKIRKTNNLGTRQFDTGRYKNGSYCNNGSYGCNVWGSSTTMLNNMGENIIAMPINPRGTALDLPTNESQMSKYLNIEYYGTLSEASKLQIDNHLWNVGILNSLDSLETNINEEKEYKWKGNVGLVNVTDYIKSSTDTSCISVSSAVGKNPSSPCQNNNYLYRDSTWTMNPHRSYDNSFYVWIIYSAGNLLGNAASFKNYIYPVVYLIPDITLEGEGIAKNPYTIVSE